MISDEAVIDAAFNAEGEWIYFFHGDETVSYNWKKQVAKDHVKIKDAYKNLPLAFKSKIDAAFNAGGEWIYFFHGDETVSYNWKKQVAKDHVKIKDAYPNLPWT
jgi:Mor family transcriptional regulator